MGVTKERANGGFRGHWTSHFEERAGCRYAEMQAHAPAPAPGLGISVLSQPRHHGAYCSGRSPEWSHAVLGPASDFLGNAGPCGRWHHVSARAHPFFDTVVRHRGSHSSVGNLLPLVDQPRQAAARVSAVEAPLRMTATGFGREGALLV